METRKEDKREIFPILDESLVSLDTCKRHLTEYQLGDLKPYKPSYIVINGNVTRNYTAPGAFAHTIPSHSSRPMCRLPWESIDYSVQPELEIHEILHHLYPNKPDEVIQEMSLNPSRRYEARSRAIIKYR